MGVVGNTSFGQTGLSGVCMDVLLQHNFSSRDDRMDTSGGTQVLLMMLKLMETHANV